MMKRFLITILFLNFFLAPMRPNADVVPDRGSGSGGGCALIQEANANMAPPPNDCKGKKVGVECETLRGEAGTCQLVCPYPDPKDCPKDEDKEIECVARAKSNK